jgi:hypothetical protein
MHAKMTNRIEARRFFIVSRMGFWVLFLLLCLSLFGRKHEGIVVGPFDRQGSQTRFDIPICNDPEFPVETKSVSFLAFRKSVALVGHFQIQLANSSTGASDIHDNEGLLSLGSAPLPVDDLVEGTLAARRHQADASCPQFRDVEE